MTRFALSTMFAQHERFEDGAEFARFAAAAGYDAIEISHSTSAAKIRQIAGARVLPIVAVHQPAPFEHSPFGMPNTDLNLASLDEDERDEALYFARRSIEVAAELGARYVVVHLGHIPDAQLKDMDARLRRSDSRQGYVPGALRRSAIQRRSHLVEPYAEAARKSLVELASAAGRHRVTLGVESRVHFHEIPLPAELPLLFNGIDIECAGYWHDVGHAEVLHRLGYIAADAWFAAANGRVVGAHVHDVRGLVDHRAPGTGDVDWSAHVPHLAALDCWTLEIDQHEPDEAVCATPALLRRELSRTASPG